LKRITDEYNANVLNIGRAGGRTGPSDANLAQVTGVPDTNMRTLMDRAAGLSRSMSNGELRRLGELRDQQAGITTSPSFSPRERAEQRNTIDRQIMEQERSTLRRIQQFEQEQSVYWGRRIRLSDITRGTRISDLPLLAPR